MQVLVATYGFGSSLHNNVIEDEVDNVVQVDFISDLLVDIFWNLKKEEFKKYDEVVASLRGLGSCVKYQCKLDL